MSKKMNFLKSRRNTVENLALEACEFYMNNVKEEEMQKVDEYIYMEVMEQHEYPADYKFDIEKTEEWLRYERHINMEFLTKFEDNVSVMAFLYMNNLCMTVIKLPE